MFDVIIIGGSYAGLSAALMIARMCKTVLIIDSGERCNLLAKEVHNFIPHDGDNPGDIIIKAKQDLWSKHSSEVQFINGLAVDVKNLTASAASEPSTTPGTDTLFEVFVENRESSNKNETYQGRRLLFASGMKESFPAIPGFRECWTISTHLCPFCHGYEEKGKKIGFLDNTPALLMFTSLLLGLSSDVTVFTNGQRCILDENQRALMFRKKVTIVEDEIDSIIHQNGHMSSVVLKNGKNISLDILFHHIHSYQSCPLPEKLGCELIQPFGYLKINDKQQTTIPGIYAAGDCATMYRQIALAIAAGSQTAAWLTIDLAMNDFMK
jgi:thioredoxin reductase